MPQFSAQLPTLQLSISASSLETFKKCPRLYYYTVIRRRTTRQVSTDLQFGLHLHKALERYHFALATGTPCETAVRLAVKHALKESWGDKSLAAPKSRESLIRAIIWYAATFNPDPLETAIIGGIPAVEMPFVAALWEAPTGEPYTLTGRFDRVFIQDGHMGIEDTKTTKYPLDADAFSPHLQLGLYWTAAQITLAKLPRWLVIDQIQVLNESVKIARIPVVPPDPQAWLDDLALTLEQMWHYAERNRWPQNETACWRCPFRPVCAAQQNWEAALMSPLYQDRPDA